MLIEKGKITQAEYLLQYGKNQEFLLDINHVYQVYCAYSWGVDNAANIDRAPLLTEEEMKQLLDEYTVPKEILEAISKIKEQDLVDEDGKPRKNYLG